MREIRNWVSRHQNRRRGPIGASRSINPSRSAPRASEGLVSIQVRARLPGEGRGGRWSGDGAEGQPFRPGGQGTNPAMRARLEEDIRRLLVSGYGEPPLCLDDGIPEGARRGYDDTVAIPPGRHVVASGRAWPSTDAVSAAMLSLLGLGESPPGSKCNALTRWYGQGCVPWAVIAVSKACVDAGFSDGA